MFNTNDLFEKRSIVGARLEQILEQKSYTKTKLCEETGISRPTLNKLLDGTLTSKTNFEKHLSKILFYFSLTPDALLGNAKVKRNQTHKIRNMLRMSAENVAETTGIPLPRLKQIEAGAQATTAELRDIALCCYTSVAELLGRNIFEEQTCIPSDVLYAINREAEDFPNGFWGHVGIRPINTDQYLWFPITIATRRKIREANRCDRCVVPCMNNKILYLNMKNIADIILLDEACDPPEQAQWDPNVEWGDFPPVVYEALTDYFHMTEQENFDDNLLSPWFKSFLDILCEQNNWTIDSMIEMVSETTVYFRDGRTTCMHVDFDGEQTITKTLFHVFCYGTDLDDELLHYSDISGVEIMTNQDNISLLIAPLAKIEEVIVWERLLEEQE